jgi:predicted protein tyrosine phosphatase
MFDPCTAHQFQFILTASARDRHRDARGCRVKHVLFICSQNRLRSPTAEQVFSTFPGLVCKSCGLNADATRATTPELLEWADIIVVMEKAHRNKLLKKYKPYVQKASIFCLNIPDEYDFMDPILVRLLKARVTPLLPVGR